MTVKHWTDDAIAQPIFSTVIPATGPAENIFVILGTATRLLRELDIPADRIAALRDAVMAPSDYDEAVELIERWFVVHR